MRKILLFLLVVAVMLSGCNSFGKKKGDKKPAEVKKEAAKMEESSDVDFQAFLGRLRQAVSARDLRRWLR